MPTFARKPSTMSSLFLVDIPQNSMVGQQRQQISELQFNNFPTFSTFLCWKIRFKNQVTICTDFSWDAMSWIKEVQVVDSLEELKSSQSIHGKIPIFEMLGREDCFCSKQDHSEFPVQEGRSVLEEQKAGKMTAFFENDKSPSWSTKSYWRSWYRHWIMQIYSLSLFVMRMFRNSIKDGTKFYYLCQRYHLTVLELYDLDTPSEDIGS